MLSNRTFQKTCVLLFSTLLAPALFAQVGNHTISSFPKAKRTLERNVYQDMRQTLYCQAQFDQNKIISAPQGFVTTKYVKRAARVEWEHVVPAENFGRSFEEWREGHPQCIDSKGRQFKGRKCAEKVNIEFRLMQADMHNLFPAIGAVNALRSNYNFVMLEPEAMPNFGSCEMKIKSKKAQPPKHARGVIARTYLYMDHSYSRYSMSRQQRQLMAAWDKQHPVDALECQRAKRIEDLQSNANKIVKQRCIELDLYH